MICNPSRDFWANRKVLLTGHTGFKGAWLAIWLELLGAKVLGLSIDDHGGKSHFIDTRVGSRCQTIFADICDPLSWRDEVQAFCPEVVFHLAAQSLVRPSYIDPVGTFRTNILGTASLLNELRDINSVKSILVVTTDKVYRDVHLRIPFVESDSLGGHDPYSASKAAAEIITTSFRSSFFHESRVALFTCRAGNVIGGGDWSNDRLLPDAVRSWTLGQPLYLRNPESIRPWQHVLEPLTGYLLAAEKSFENPDFPPFLNFGPQIEHQFKVIEIAQMASEVFGSGEIQINQSISEPAESEWLHLDSSAAQRLLNYRPRLSIQETIQFTIQWYVDARNMHDAGQLCIDQIEQFEQKIHNI
jgi:CDP-glucose 4,6-dehydratase